PRGAVRLDAARGGQPATARARRVRRTWRRFLASQQRAAAARARARFGRSVAAGALSQRRTAAKPAAAGRGRAPDSAGGGRARHGADGHRLRRGGAVVKSALAYFVVVRPHAAYALVALAAVTIVGMVTVWFNPSDLDSGLGMTLFVQMLLASSGFLPSARRGHYDTILVHGRHWTAALAAHWLVSIAPGALAWLFLAMAGAVLGSPAAMSALMGSR